MKILHTSDWHLGQHLISKDRRREHDLFLDWLTGIIKDEQIDILLVAGDIFDSGTPPNYALERYYNFLTRVATETECRQVVIIGGNHDSPATINAPRQVLKCLRIHVVGSIGEKPAENVIVVRDEEGVARCIICCVPFLRDRDIRSSVPGESYDEKSKALLEGIKSYYRQMKDVALIKAQALSTDGSVIPVVATGHLFAAGGQATEGVRDIYVGSLGQVHASYFPEEFAYVALGHLHKPQKVADLDQIRYSGSPIPFSFSEAGDPKEVVIVKFDDQSARMTTASVVVPVFQDLRCIRGNLDEILSALQSMESPQNSATIWVEIQLDSRQWSPDLINRINETVADRPIEVLAVKYLQGAHTRRLTRGRKMPTLEQLTPQEVFEKRIAEEEKLEPAQANDLQQAFVEIINSVLTGAANDLQ
jgi:exonuclease SbcD